MTSDSQPGEKLRVQDGKRFIEFQGELLGKISTETPNEPRWLEMELYRLTDGTGRYVVHIIGKSVVYHAAMSSCNRGVPTPGRDLPGDSEPCRECHPPAQRNPDEMYDLESNRHTARVGADAPDIIEKLKIPDRKRPGEPAILTAPAQRLLEVVAPRDTAIASAMMVVEQL